MAWFIINKQIVDSKVGSKRLRVHGPSGQAYIFEADKPVEVLNEEDIAFFNDPNSLPAATPYGVTLPQIVPWEPEGPEGEAVVAAVSEAEQLRTEVNELKGQLEELRTLLAQALQKQAPASRSSSGRSRRKGSRSDSSGATASTDTNGSVPTNEPAST